jgi:osomolarity two-component system, sensor histidine kinase CHK1
MDQHEYPDVMDELLPPIENNNQNQPGKVAAFDSTESLKSKSLPVLSPRSTHSSDYFSIHRQNGSPQSSNTLLSPGSISNLSSNGQTGFMMPQYAPKRYPSKFNLTLSPMVTSPSAVDEQSTPHSPIPTTLNTVLRDANQPSIVFELEENSYNIVQDRNILNQSSALLYDFLNISLKDGQIHSNFASAKKVILDMLEKDYTILSKLYGDDNNDPIFCFVVEQNSTKKQFVVRFVCDLMTGPFARLMNTYYTTTGLNTRTVKEGFPHMIEGSEWNYTPRTLPYDIPGVFPCQSLKLINNNKSLLAFFPLKNGYVPIKEIKLELTREDMLSTIAIIVNLLKLLKRIHSYGIVVNSLTSSNVFVHPETFEVSILDFDFAFSSAIEFLDLPSRLASKSQSMNYLPFTAPENLSNSYPVDFRADIYSVGQIIYILVGGKIRKPSVNPNANVRRQTKTQCPLVEINPNVPSPFSKIVSKMIAFDPRLRYSSIDFIIHDFSKLNDTLRGKPLGSRIINKNRQRIPIMIPYKMVGRDKISEAIASYISSRSVKTFTLVGPPGIGKSTIMKTLKSPARMKNLFFVTWKCYDLNYYNSKFQTFDLVLSQIIKTILSMEKSEIRFWRDLLSAEVKADLSTLFELIPELKSLLGSKYKSTRRKTAVKMMYQQELSHQYIIKKLFELFSAHAGVVFTIENIQAISENEAALLEEIWNHLSQEFAEGELHFILLASYAPKAGEESISENVSQCLRKNVIEVDPLTEDDVSEILDQSLFLYDMQFKWKDLESKSLSYFYELDNGQTSSPERKNMARSIFMSSKGNPMAVREIITKTHFAQLESPNALDPVDVFSALIPDQSSVFLSGGFQLCSIYAGVGAYDERISEILKYCACVSAGSTFNLHFLTIVSGVDPTELYKVLFTGTIVGILTLSSNISKLAINRINEPGFILNELTTEEKNNLLKCTKFRFAHDSIQRNIIAQMTKNDELEEYHRLCGVRLFATHLGHNESNPNLTMTSSDCYAVAFHFIHSWKVARKEETEVYIKVLITAAWCAYTSYEHIRALDYFKVAKLLVTDQKVMKGLDWIEIHIHALKGKHDESIRLSNLAIKKYRNNPEDYAQFMLSKIQSLCSKDEWTEGYNVALETLQALDFKLDLGKMTMDEVLQYTNTKLKPKLPTSISEIKNLKNAPNNTNRKVLLTQMVLVEMNQFAFYLGKPHLLVFANLFNFTLFLEWGRSIYCSLSLITIASIEAAADAKGLKRAREYCRLAFSMTNSGSLEANELFTTSFKAYCVMVGSVLEPIEKVVHSYDLIMASADAQSLETAFTKIFFFKFRYYTWLIQGLTLPRLKDKMKILKDTHITSDDPNNIFNRFYCVVTDVLSVLNGELNYETYVNSYDQLDGSNLVVKYQSELIFSTNCIFCCYILKKYDRAAEIALTKLDNAWANKPISIELVWARYVFVLAIYKERVRSFEANEGYDAVHNEEINNILSDHLAFFEELSRQNTAIFMSMYLSVAALLKVLDTTNYSQIDTLCAFERAVENCADQQSFFFEAIIAEECGRWLLKATKDERIRSRYLKRAYKCYDTWGCKVKVQQMENEFGSIVTSKVDLDDGHTFQRRRSRCFTGDSLREVVDTSQLDSVDRTNSFSKRPTSRNPSENSTMLMGLLMKNEPSSADERGSWSSKNDQDSCTSKSIDMSASSVDDTKSVPNTADESTEKDSDDRASISDDEWDKNIIMDLSIKISQLNDIEELIETLLIFSMHFIECEYGCLVLNSDDGTPFIRAICLQNDEVKFMSQEVLSLREDLAPAHLIQECIDTDTSIWRGSDKFYFDTTYKPRDAYLLNNDCENFVCIPIRNGNSSVAGALYLENEKELTFIQSKKIELLEYISLQTLISINKVEMLAKLRVAKKAAEDATADKASFLANMSHEIRTPFNSLMSCAIFLLDTNLSRSQRMYVETIRTSALVTLNIIDGILSFSKLEHGSLTLAYEPFNLNLCIEEAIQLVAEQSSAKHLEMVFVDDAYPVNIIYGDKTRVTQIIINLMGNSTKFTNVGFIIIKTSANEISKSRYEMKITVKDSGIGIPPGSKSRLFKMFNQLDGSSKRAYGGSGLGLAISKKIAELMGGDIDYESEESVGTEFYFTFTTNGEVEPLEKLKDDSSRVVIFDDRQLSTESLRIALERRGIKSENIKLLSKLDEDVLMDKALIHEFGNADFVFFSHEFATTKKLMESVRAMFANSFLVCQVPLGVRIPDFLGDESFDDVDDEEEEGDNNNKYLKEKPLIDILLLTPFKGSRITEILQLKEKLHERKKLKQQQTKVFTSPEKDAPTSVLNASKGEKKDQKIQARKLAEDFPLTILIAEDNAINTKVVRLQLKRLGYDSDHGNDGVEAVEMMDAKVEKDGVPYNLVLMDLQMPRKDGFEATVEIKGKYGNRTRVVALSANVYNEEKNRCKEIGMSGFLNKPLLPEALAVQLQEAYKQYH